MGRGVLFRSLERANGTSRNGASRDPLLDAAERVVKRDGFGNLTLDAVAAEAGVSKGGLLHHFSSKDRLVQAMVARCAGNWRACCARAFEEAPAGPGRMARGLLGQSLSDAKAWSEQCRRSSSAVFAALVQNPSLIEPMREVYSEVRRRLQGVGIARGVGEAVAAAIDGLWLYWVLGLVTVDQAMVVRVRTALEEMLARAGASPMRTGRRSSGARRGVRGRRRMRTK